MSFTGGRETQALLPRENPRFVCPGCRKVLLSPRNPAPGWLRCMTCRTKFIANRSVAMQWLFGYIVFGSILAGAGIGLTIWSYEAAEKSGAGM